MISFISSVDIINVVSELEVPDHPDFLWIPSTATDAAVVKANGTRFWRTVSVHSSAMANLISIIPQEAY